VDAIGVGVIVAGGALALYGALLLHGRGRPRRGRHPAFVIAGPYRRLRNPVLAGVILLTAGLALTTRSFVLALATVLGALGAHLWVVRVEEPRLASRFGEAYAAYRRRVPRWWPRPVRPVDDEST
jgi:protein-S-isoprenylcysteine O-methyltransferase Ste14